jgi:hypothetical protein
MRTMRRLTVGATGSAGWTAGLLTASADARMIGCGRCCAWLAGAGVFAGSPFAALPIISTAAKAVPDRRIGLPPFYPFEAYRNILSANLR